MLFPRRAPGKSEIRAPARKLFWAWLTLVVGLSPVLPSSPPPFPEQSMTKQKERLVSKEYPWLGIRGICEAIFCGANLNSQDLDAFKEVNTVISCAMIQPFKTSSPLTLCRHRYKQHTALKQMLGSISFFVL